MPSEWVHRYDASEEEVKDESTPSTVTGTSTPQFPESPAWASPVSKKSTSSHTSPIKAADLPTNSFLFGVCCTSPHKQSWEETNFNAIELEEEHEEITTRSLLIQLMEAEAEGREIVFGARKKQFEALERAKIEAEEEAKSYGIQFEIEFAKLETKHLEEVDKLSIQSERRVEQVLAKEAKKVPRQKQHTVFFVLNQICTVDLSLPTIAADRIRRAAGVTIVCSIPKGVISHRCAIDFGGPDTVEEFGLCPKHRSIDKKSTGSSQTLSQGTRSKRRGDKTKQEPNREDKRQSTECTV